jgi:hypothetical protein
MPPVSAGIAALDDADPGDGISVRTPGIGVAAPGSGLS